MRMDRYLCQLCWSIVKYGESHPCFFYKDDDEVYTALSPNEMEETEREGEATNEAPTGDLSDNNRRLFALAEQSCIKGTNEASSLLLENNGQVSLPPASRRKISRLSLMPSKNGLTDSKSASSSNTETEESKDSAKKFKNSGKNESAAAIVSLFGFGSNSAMAPDSVSVAGPSGNQTQPHKTEKEKPFACVCGKDFARKQNLEVHERTHSGEKPFVCGRCDQAFAKQSYMTRHLLIHTEERPFVCGFCDKRFARKDVLNIHIRTHTKEKPYKCEECGKEFSDPSCYSRHLKQVHSRK